MQPKGLEARYFSNEFMCAFGLCLLLLWEHITTLLGKVQGENALYVKLCLGLWAADGIALNQVVERLPTNA